jgi:hypothetical protein
MATKLKSTADIRKFTGFLAPDGSTHETVKKAIEYTRDLKVKEALADFGLVTPESSEGVSDGENGYVIHVENLPAFLAAHRADIELAFNQEVSMRSPRKPKGASVLKSLTATKGDAVTKAEADSADQEQTEFSEAE